MRQTFRMNVHGEGYILFSGLDKLQFLVHPLDVESTAISRSYLFAQKRIDDTIESLSSRWNLCITNRNPQGFPVVAYGGLLPIKDDRGRIGVHFIHAIEVDESLSVDVAVRVVIMLLSQQILTNITKLLADAARGDTSPHHVINFIVDQVAKLIQHEKSLPIIRPSHPFKEIKHDCGGASAVAWLAMTVSHLGCPAPWDIYDVYSRDTNTISTISSFNGASKVQLLSEYIFQSVQEYQILEYILHQRVTMSNNVTMKADSSQSHQKTSTVELESPPPSEDCTETPSTSHSELNTTQISTKPSQVAKHPANSQVTQLISLSDDKLLLYGEKRNYVINTTNLLGFSEDHEYFEFTMLELEWYFLKSKELKLVLPKKDMKSEQINKIHDFLRRVERH